MVSLTDPGGYPGGTIPLPVTYSRNLLGGVIYNAF